MERGPLNLSGAMSSRRLRDEWASSLDSLPESFKSLSVELAKEKVRLVVHSYHTHIHFP